MIETAPLSSNNTSDVEEDMMRRTATSSNSSSSNNDSIPAPLLGRSDNRSMQSALLAYCVLFVVTLVTISITLHQYPLIPPQPDSLDWNYNWLIATVVDYYGACLCFGGIVLSSEPSWIQGLAWNAGFLLLGSPVCCLWVILRIRAAGSLRLVDSAGSRRDV